MVKKWRCTVCGYIHEGPEPPDICPVCGAGKEFFEEVKEESGEKAAGGRGLPTWQLDGSETQVEVIKPAIFKISYGLYVVTSINGGRKNGQTANTVFQVTDNPMRVAAGLNKNNLTCEFVRESGVFAVNILGQDGHDMVRHFGFRSGRDVDKFADVAYVTGVTGAPILEKCIAYLECRVLPEKTVDVGSHYLFIAEVVAGKLKVDAEPMTYAYYRRTK